MEMMIMIINSNCCLNATTHFQFEHALQHTYIFIYIIKTMLVGNQVK